MEREVETIVKSACRMCHGICGLRVYLKNGRVVKVTGDPECPTSRGFMCAKGKASVELLYHPNRLKYPLKRVGARGENKWQRISWDEALDIVAENLLSIKRNYGAESIAGTLGTGRPYVNFFIRFLNCLGTPNYFGVAHICYLPRVTASAMTCGQLPICDFYGFGGVYPKCVVNWGCNITESGASDGMCSYQLDRAVKRGARLIVVDPRRTGIAARADHWLQLRPGTDDALVMGMLNVIIKERLYDHDFVAKWTVGFDELAGRVEEYPPEKVEEITWVPADTIRSAARTYATSKPACIQWGVAIDQNINSFQTIRALLILRTITGNLDVPGGDVFWVPPANVVVQAPYLNPGLQLAEIVPPETQARKIGTGIYKVNHEIHPRLFIDAILDGKPYPIKAFVIMGTNTLVAHCYAPEMIEALKKLDFIVAIDMFMTPTTQLADVVLPSASWLETDDVADMHFVWCVLARQKVATIGECRDDKQIMIDIAHRMGMGEHFPWRNVREYCDWVLKDSGITFDELKERGIIMGEMRYRKYEQEGFATPSGKVELYSSSLETMGYDPLPYYAESPESPYSTPELFQEYPLIITTGARSQPYFHSEGRQIPSLRKLVPDPLIQIHPDTAKNLGIADGYWVWVESRRGRIKQRAQLTDIVHPGVVNVPHGWWFPEKDPPEYGFRESSANLLTGGTNYDPHTGSESLRSFLCKVYKCK